MFYKKMYLLAVYDNEDYCIGTYDNIKEFALSFNIKAESLEKCINRKKDLKTPLEFLNYKIYFIDIKKIHRDYFYKEDKIFLEKFKNENLSIIDLCKKNNIHIRKYYRTKGIIRNELQR